MTTATRPPHPPAALVREAYAAFNARDVAAALVAIKSPLAAYLKP